MKAEKAFFQTPAGTAQHQYEALRAFFFDGKSAMEVSRQFGYSLATVYSLTRDFRNALKDGSAHERFFASKAPGRNPRIGKENLDEKIIALRKQYLSIDQIKTLLDAQGENVSQSYIHLTLKHDGFTKLPRRGKIVHRAPDLPANIVAPKAALLEDEHFPTAFNSAAAGILCFIPYLLEYGIDALIEQSSYPGTSSIPKLNSILAFVALKLSNVARYSHDDLWCMDRGLGLYAGLNVLPKASWYSSFSHRVTRAMNLDFLKRMNQVWRERGLLSDTANLDFTAIPYWGDDAHLENNWSGKRNESLASILAALAHDPESGIITYGNANVRHRNEADTILEFLDFYHADQGVGKLKYLVFDSKFTVYENFSRLDSAGVKFITIRRRGKNIVEELEAIPASQWKRVRVMAGNGKMRSLKIIDQRISLKSCDCKLRQIAIDSRGREKPALVITNDHDVCAEFIVRKYARRWLVEKTISENAYFFHLNKISSSMVIKVDFDLTMTILAYNLYRLAAMSLEGYAHNTASSIYEKFIRNSGSIEIIPGTIDVSLKKKRNLPLLLTALRQIPSKPASWLGGRRINFCGASHS